MERNNLRDSKAMYKSLRRSPLERNRTTSDVWFIVVWAFIFSTWLFSVVYVLITSNPIENIKYLLDHSSDLNSDRVEEFMDTYFQSSPVIIIITGLALAFAFLIGFLALLRHKPIPCCRFGIVILVLSLLVYNYLSYYLFTRFSRDYQEVLFWYGQFIVNTISTLYIIFALICIARSGIAPVISAIEKIPRIIIRFPYLAVFSILIYILILFIALLSVSSAIVVVSENFLFYIITLGGFYIVTFMHYYGLVIISQIVATWHWTEDKSEISNALVLQCIVNVTKFHFGSIAFGATVIGPIIASIIAFISTMRTRNSSHSKGFFDIVLTVFLTFDITKYSLITNSIYSQDFYKSTRKVFQLFTKQTLTSFSFLWIFHGIEIGVFAIMLLLVSLPPILWSSLNIVSFSLFTTAGVFLLTLLLPLKLAENTIGIVNYLCTVEDTDNVDEPNGTTFPVPLNERS